MPSVAYGAAKHFLKDSSAIVLTPIESDGTAGTLSSSFYVSPLISDISLSVGGTIKEFIDYGGDFAAFEVSGEYADVTFTIIPTGTTRANANASIHAFRKGTPFKVENAPTVKLFGHTLEGSPIKPDLLNTGSETPLPAAFLQSMETRMSLEGETTGTITLRYYFKSSISSVIVPTS